MCYLAHRDDPRPPGTYPLSRGFRRPSSLPAIQQDNNEVQVTPLAQGLRGMREYPIAFSAWSHAAAFCPPWLQDSSFDQLIEQPPDEVHIGCQVGKVYRIVLEEQEAMYAMLVVLLEFTPQARKKKPAGCTRVAQR